MMTMTLRYVNFCFYSLTESVNCCPQIQNIDTPTRETRTPILKRTHSSIMAGSPSIGSASTSVGSSLTSASAYKKRRPNAVGLLSDQLASFKDAFVDSFPSSQSSHTLPATPHRKRDAIRRAQVMEKGLGVPRLVSLIKIFQNDVSAADTYLILEEDELRKEWVNETLSDSRY